MSSAHLPKAVPKHIIVPPIKCQGIKTKLIPFILSNIQWRGEGTWIEPFLGSGVVLFNVQPKRARVGDSNPHIIDFYRSIQTGDLTPSLVKAYLVEQGAELSSQGETHYYAVRERFNQNPNALDFLFLNRSCFNGVMRFNGKGRFNVPFCRKPDRFQPAYITKIVNQVKKIRDIIADKEWEFITGDWRELVQQATTEDFIYLDPPYIGRHTDYYSRWTEKEAVQLAQSTHLLPCGVALSMWRQNRYRVNTHIEEHWGHMAERTMEHFYHVGSTENLRHAMTESLLITPGFEAVNATENVPLNPLQIPLFE